MLTLRWALVILCLAVIFVGLAACVWIVMESQ